MNTELLNNANEDFDLNMVDTVDQDTVEVTGPRYPVLQWNNGDIKMKNAGGMDYLGGWFVKDEAIDPEILTAAGWTKTDWTHDNGSADSGFWRREIAVSVIATRRRWEVYQEGANRSVAFPWKSYNAAKEAGRPSGRLHVLCIVKGLESVGPVVLTLKGSGAMSFEGANGEPGALGKFAQTIVAGANRLSDEAARRNGQRGGKRWPFRAFWLPVGADRDQEGAPKYTKVGSGSNTRNVVLPVALGLPAKATDVTVDVLKRHSVGASNLAAANDIYAESADWVVAWDSIDPTATEEAAATATESAPETPKVDEAAMESLGL